MRDEAAARAAMFRYMGYLLKDSLRPSPREAGSGPKRIDQAMGGRRPGPAIQRAPAIGAKATGGTNAGMIASMSCVSAGMKAAPLQPP